MVNLCLEMRSLVRFSFIGFFLSNDLAGSLKIRLTTVFKRSTVDGLAEGSN